MKVYAITLGKDTVNIEVFNVVMNGSRYDILFDPLGLTERDVEFLQYIKEAERKLVMKSQEEKIETTLSTIEDIMYLSN
ncbi:hypothetical protein DJ531_09705 [Sulfolobus sp. A20-N-F6]|nr:hypothetical protein DJ531_09705 [Sulfolobus sp. A20-N-F6]TRM87077.1 hypothetical protein DJ529_09550 [Sulfolobus sp. C3]TRN01352.1 hypothetical protein DJ527_05775 [Sulfolobus sp. F1]